MRSALSRSLSIINMLDGSVMPFASDYSAHRYEDVGPMNYV